jgi:hypothetical protein
MAVTRICAVAYTPDTNTNQNVVASLSECPEAATVTNNDGKREYTFTGNGNFTFEFIDIAGMIRSVDAIVTRIDRTPVTGHISYTTDKNTNTDVTANISFYKTGVTVTNNKGSTGYTFTGNDSFTFEFVDSYGNTGSETATVWRIDKTPVTGHISYTPDKNTNTDVTANISFYKTGVTVTNNGKSTGYTFTGNDSFTFEFVDSYGNTGSETATVWRIDKEAPYATQVTYDPNIATNTNVKIIVTINEPVQAISGRNGTGTTRNKTYDNNVSTEINFSDLVGNAGSTGIYIDWIDTKKPGVKSTTYDPDTATSGDVVVTLTADKIIRQPTGRSGVAMGTGFTKTYEIDTDEEFLITDLVGNTGVAEVHINRIDKTAPIATQISYTPSVPTNTGVEVTLETDERVYLPEGRTGSATGTIFTKIFTGNTTGTVTFYDHVYNQGSTGISITRIDTTAIIPKLTYSPSTTTSEKVTATISFNKTGVTIDNNEGLSTYTFTDNDSFTFLFHDQAGNTGNAIATVAWITHPSAG